MIVGNRLGSRFHLWPQPPPSRPRRQRIHLMRDSCEQPLETGSLPIPRQSVVRRATERHENWSRRPIDPLPREKDRPVLEHGPCRHPLASLMASAMVLDDVVQVDCAAGCGHRLYSDRGPLECPCHWQPVKAAWVSRLSWCRFS